MHVKRSLVKCLHDRAKGVTTSQSNLVVEQLHLAKVLRQNGHPPPSYGRQPLPHLPHVILALLKRTTPTHCEHPLRGRHKWGDWTDLPWVQPEGSVPIWPHTPLHPHQVKNVLPQGKQSRDVCKIPCSCGKVYIGKTDRRLHTRLQEHQKACWEGSIALSAVAEHAYQHQHPIQWEETSIVDHTRGHRELLLKEAIHIRSTHPQEHSNRDIGTDLPSCWLTVQKAREQRAPDRARSRPSGHVPDQQSCI